MLALNGDGSTRWATRYGSGYGWSVAVAPNGDVVVAGDTDTVDDFGNGVLPSYGREDVFILRFDPDGTLKAAQKFGGPMLDTAHAVTVDTSGGIVVSGIQMGGIDFGDGPAPENGGGSFLVKLDALDNLVYAKVSSTPSLGALALEPLPDGGILAQFPESAARFEVNGEQQWNTAIGSTRLPRTIARNETSAWFPLQVDPDPACEWTTGPILAELSLADGTLLSTRQVSVGPDSWLSLWAAARFPNQVVVAGWLMGAGFDFGNGDIGPTDGADPIVVGYAP